MQDENSQYSIQVSRTAWAELEQEGKATELSFCALLFDIGNDSKQPSPNSTVFPKGTTATEKESPSQMVFLLSEGHCFVLFACLDFNSHASHVH